MVILKHTPLLLLLAFGPSQVALADADYRWLHGRHHGLDSGPLVELVRRETAKYLDVQAAIDAGYAPGACVSGRESGAMGIHYANGALLNDGIVDPAYPEVLIYEPQRNGRMRLVGAEYITFTDFWPAGTAPELAGHLLNYTGTPNRYGIPAHFEIHVWAWRTNPNGPFADWNPRVTCEHQSLPES